MYESFGRTKLELSKYLGDRQAQAAVCGAACEAMQAVDEFGIGFAAWGGVASRCCSTDPVDTGLKLQGHCRRVAGTLLKPPVQKQ